ncbi:MAG: ribonuclease Y [Patescibacteria group bacterium]|nr:MAG: ribonuclease Y [Patescibacteria group bacterium]
MLANIFKKLGLISQKELEEAKTKAESILLEAKEKSLKIIQEAEEKAEKIREKALEIEKLALEKEKTLEREKQSLEDKKRHLEQQIEEINKKKAELLTKLEKIAQLTSQQAKDLLLKTWEEKLKKEIAERIKSAEEEIKDQSETKAKEILVDAMRFGATDYVAEYTLSTVNLPNEDIKGRIIGKEGRNIRAFELATGVDVDLEEEGVIKLSSFDPVRRAVAKEALERLIRDGRIQPQRIEEIVAKTKSDLDKVIFQAGKELANKVGVYNLPTELIKLLGRFKYRYSYGQNMIQHTLEETKIGIALAHELKANVQVVRLACLLHDIGKVVTDKEGSHIELGVEILKKHNMPQAVISAVEAHHEDIPFPSVEAVIVYIADAVSGGRPGARHEDFENYLKRIKTIEETAKNFKGVSDAYALQAGRELRVIVKPEEIDDDSALILSQKLKEELEKKFDVFPGQIKITVIREFRAEAVTRI